MRYLIILVGLIFLCGCSKKTLSGVFEHKDEDSYDRYDFRTDGTVLNDYKMDSRFFRATVNARGSYIISGNEVVVDAIGTSSLGSGILTNHVIFRTDGNDLIHILLIQNSQNGPITNIDENQDRYIKQTQ